MGCPHIMSANMWTASYGELRWAVWSVKWGSSLHAEKANVWRKSLIWLGSNIFIFPDSTFVTVIHEALKKVPIVAWLLALSHRIKDDYVLVFLMFK